jgi:hypothetical protein
MKKKYTTTTEIWRNGLPVEPGTVLMLSDNEAKYLKHALVEDGVETAPADVVSVTADVPAEDEEAIDTPAASKRRK